MIEYYGWVNISDDPYESDREKLWQIFENVKTLVKGVEFEGRILTMKRITTK
jgi:hypothetical protein